MKAGRSPASVNVRDGRSCVRDVFEAEYDNRGCIDREIPGAFPTPSQMSFREPDRTQSIAADRDGSNSGQAVAHPSHNVRGGHCRTCVRSLGFLEEGHRRNPLKCPAERPLSARAAQRSGAIVATPVLGGLHINSPDVIFGRDTPKTASEPVETFHA